MDFMRVAETKARGMSNKKTTDVPAVREQQIKSDVQHVRGIAKRAGKIAKRTKKNDAGTSLPPYGK